MHFTMKLLINSFRFPSNDMIATVIPMITCFQIEKCFGLSSRKSETCCAHSAQFRGKRK